MGSSLLAQYVLDTMLRSKVSGLRWKVLAKLRRTLILAGDPLVNYSLDGTLIDLPLSHDLPIHRRLLPHYSSNVGRVAARVKCKYPDLVFIDIGANVGDTASILRHHTHFPILCIEGQPRYCAILRRNLHRLGGDVVLEESFVGEETGSIAGTMVSDRGTGFIAAANSEGLSGLQTMSLPDILLKYPSYGCPKMIKTDTDGFDGKILRGAMAIIERSRPILFFEYAPHYRGVTGDDGFSIFDALRGAGYQTTLFYHDNGDYLLAAQLANRKLLEDLHQSVDSPGRTRYYDVCAFHAEDADLAAEVRQMELDFFAREVTSPSATR